MFIALVLAANYKKFLILRSFVALNFDQSNSPSKNYLTASAASYSEFSYEMTPAPKNQAPQYVKFSNFSPALGFYVVGANVVEIVAVNYYEFSS